MVSLWRCDTANVAVVMTLFLLSPWSFVDERPTSQCAPVGGWSFIFEGLCHFHTTDLTDNLVQLFSLSP